MEVNGKTLNIDKERQEAAILIGDFVTFGKKMSQKFENTFFDRYADLDSALNNVGSIATSIYNDAVNHAVDVITENKVYTYDGESFVHYLNDNGFFDYWNELVGSYIDKYNEIETEKKMKNEYRKARKDSRGRVIGGGFGFEGALKGIASAAAINGSIGLAHSAVNAIGNLGTAINADQAKKQVYEQMKQYLPFAVQETIKTFSFATMHIISDETGCRYDIPTEEDRKKSDSLYMNVATGKVPDEDEVDTIYQAITLNPNNEDAFYYLILKFGDTDRQIEIYGDSLGNNIKKLKIDNFTKYGLEKLKKRGKALSQLDDRSYLKALKSILSELKAEKKRIGIPNDVITTPESNVLSAIRTAEMGMRNQGMEADTLSEDKPKKAEVYGGSTDQEIIKAAAKLREANKNNVNSISNINEDRKHRIRRLRERADTKYGDTFEKMQSYINIGMIHQLHNQEKSKYRKAYNIPQNEEIYIGASTALIGVSTGLAITSKAIYGRVDKKTGNRVRFDKLPSYDGFEWRGDCLYCDNVFLGHMYSDGTRDKAILVKYLQEIYVLVNDIFPDEKKSFEETDKYTTVAGENQTSSIKDYVSVGKETLNRVKTTFNGTKVEENHVSDTDNVEVSEYATEIEKCCKEFLEEVGSSANSFVVSDKLRRGLGIRTEERGLIGYDFTILGSGKNGFAITERGLYCREMMSSAYFMSFKDFSKTAELSWKDDTHAQILADGKAITYGAATHYEPLMRLYRHIHSVLKEGL